MAQKYFNAGLAIYRSQGNAREEARVLLNLAVIEQRQGHDDEASSSLNTLWNALKLRN